MGQSVDYAVHIAMLTCLTSDQIRLLFSSATSSVWHASPC